MITYEASALLVDWPFLLVLSSYKLFVVACFWYNCFVFVAETVTVVVAAMAQTLSICHTGHVDVV